MVRGKVQYKQCFEAANQGTPVRNPDRGPRYDENSDVQLQCQRYSGMEVVIRCHPSRKAFLSQLGAVSIRLPRRARYPTGTFHRESSLDVWKALDLWWL